MKGVAGGWGGRLTTYFLSRHEGSGSLTPSSPTLPPGESTQTALPVKRVRAVRLNGFQLCDLCPLFVSVELFDLTERDSIRDAGRFSCWEVGWLQQSE